MSGRPILIDCGLALVLAAVLLASLGLAIVAIVAGCVLVAAAAAYLLETLIGRRRRRRGSPRA